MSSGPPPTPPGEAGPFQPGRHQLIGLGGPPGGGGGARTAGFAVSVLLADSDRTSHGRGELRIEPGVIVFSPFAGARGSAPADAGGAPAAREFVHTAGSVGVTRALLRPPWAHTFLQLHDDTGREARVTLPPFAARRVLRALGAAGFTVSGRVRLRAPTTNRH